MNDNKELAVIGNYIRDKFLTHEDILLVVILLDLILKSIHIPFAGMINALVLSSIAVVYFFSAFSTLEEVGINGLDVFLYKLTGFASSLVLIGVLFKTQNWQGSLSMLYAGSLILLFTSIFIIIRKQKMSESKMFNKWLQLRSALLILAALGCILNFI